MPKPGPNPNPNPTRTLKVYLDHGKAAAEAFAEHMQINTHPDTFASNTIPEPAPIKPTVEKCSEQDMWNLTLTLTLPLTLALTLIRTKLQYPHLSSSTSSSPNPNPYRRTCGNGSKKSSLKPNWQRRQLHPRRHRQRQSRWRKSWLSLSLVNCVHHISPTDAPISLIHLSSAPI